jgi:hypothetical protein
MDEIIKYKKEIKNKYLVALSMWNYILRIKEIMKCRKMINKICLQK